MSTAAPPPSTLDLATGPGEPDDHRRRRVAPWVTAGVAVAVTALVTGGLALGGRGPLGAVAGSGPDVLHIGTGSYGGGAGDVVVDAKGLRAGRYVLTGSLPTSPTDGKAWWLTKGSVDADQVSALAAAFGLTGQPQHDGQGWVVRQGAAVLRVYEQPGLPFAFDASGDDGLCPSMPTDGFTGPDTSVGCAVTAPSPATTPAPGPDDAAMNDLARAVAAALGADPSVSVWSGAPYSGASLDPTVDGVPTSGAGIMLQASADGVGSASGWLAGFLPSAQRAGDTYPLRSAHDVFADLALMPEPAMACAEPLDGSPACGGDVDITGATYGLSLAFDDGRPVLVPSWLFATAGSDTPLARIAVEPRYVEDPAGSGSGGGSSGSSDGSPGTTAPGAGSNPTTGTEPAPPDQPADGGPLVDPAVDPVRDPDNPTTATPAGPGQVGPNPGTALWTGPRTLTLTVAGGCEMQSAVASARVTATTIVVTYAYDTVACANDLGYVVSLPVTLDVDPGDRLVVDGAGDPIPVVGRGTR